MNTTRNENRDEKRVRCHSGFERRSLNFLQTSFFARRRTRDKEGTPDRQIEIWNSYPRRRWQISFSMARGKFVERSLTAYCERGKKREREREREMSASGERAAFVRPSGHAIEVIHARSAKPLWLFVLNLSTRLPPRLSPAFSSSAPDLSVDRSFQRLSYLWESRFPASARIAKENCICPPRRRCLTLWILTVGR